MSGYSWSADEFAQLLIQRSYPERTDLESALIRDYLREHLLEFEHVEFSVRVGEGLTPDPSHLPGVQRNAAESSKKRIDVVGTGPGIVALIEAKTLVSHAVMGQLLMDKQLWLTQYPDSPEPRLVAIGRRGTPQDIGVLNDHGIDVYIYDVTTDAAAAAEGSPDGAAAR